MLWWTDQIRSDQSLSRVRLFATPKIAARQASLSITNSQSSLRLTMNRVKGKDEGRIKNNSPCSDWGLAVIVTEVGEINICRAGERVRTEERLQFLMRRLDEHLKSSLQLCEAGTIFSSTLSMMLLAECLCPFKIPVSEANLQCHGIWRWRLWWGETS